MRRQAQTEGYGAFLGLYPRGLAGACRRVALPHCLLACYLPPKAKRAPAPGTMPALPRNPCGGSNAARRAKSPALQYKAKTTSLRQGPPSRHSFPVNCRTGVHARRKTFRSMRFFGSMFTFARKPSASHQPLRKGRGIPAGEIAPSARFFEHAPGVRTAEIPHS